MLALKKRGLVRVVPLSAIQIHRPQAKKRPRAVKKRKWWNPWTWKQTKPHELEPELQQDRWIEHEEDLVREVPDTYINVVCGTVEEAARVWTAGVPNLALVRPGTARPERFRVIENESQFEAELD